MHIAGIFKALGDPLRLRVAHLLARAGELCVCDLVELLGAPQSSLSRHLALMRHLGLVECRREGRWVHYRLCPGDGCAGLAEWLVGLAAREPQLVEDARRLAAFEPTDCGRPATATSDADMETSAR